MSINCLHPSSGWRLAYRRALAPARLHTGRHSRVGRSIRPITRQQLTAQSGLSERRAQNKRKQIQRPNKRSKAAPPFKRMQSGCYSSAQAYVTKNSSFASLAAAFMHNGCYLFLLVGPDPPCGDRFQFLHTVLVGYGLP